MISLRVFQLLVDRSEAATDILPPEEIQAEQMLAAGGIFPIGSHFKEISKEVETGFSIRVNQSKILSMHSSIRRSRHRSELTYNKLHSH